jgi:restriction system protein
VEKLHVLALRQIVAEVGADRGILLSEAGFQSGAVEAGILTNVHVTSLDTLRSTASTEVTAMRLREAYDRVEGCSKRYWNIPKDTRIEFGLRPEVGQVGYSAVSIIELSSELTTKALRGSYPIVVDGMSGLIFLGPRQFSTPDEILSLVDPLLAELEKKLTECEAGIA